MKFPFTIKINDNCNLNCAGCNQFAPLAKEPGIVTFDEYKKIIDRMKYLTSEEEIPFIDIIGGEPFLNPYLYDIILYTRNIFKTQEIKIITNGTLIKSIPESHLNYYKFNNIKILYSDYHILNIDGKSKTDRSSFIYHYLQHEKTPNDPFFCPFQLSKNTSQKKIEYHINRLGNMYFCCIQCNIHLYNEYYGTNIQRVKDSDFINIFEIDKTNIRKMLIKHLVAKEKYQMCDYCSKNANMEEWKLFSHVSNQWI